MTELETLVSYFPDWESSGAIFTQMFDMPWSDYIDGSILDILYLSSHSGIKPPTQIVKHFSANHEANSASLASYLKKLFYKSWEHLWNAYVTEYSPTELMNIRETELRDLDETHGDTKSTRLTDDGSDTLTLNTTRQNSGNESFLHGHVETTDYENTTTVTEDTETTLTHGRSVTTESTTKDANYGFNTNSETPVPVSKTDASSSEVNSGKDTTANTGMTTTADDSTNRVSHTGTDTTTTTNTESHTGTETTARTNTRVGSDTASGTRNEDEEITRTRQGNPGNRPYSELIAAEFEIWKYNFFNQVFEDCDSILTLKIFNPSAKL